MPEIYHLFVKDGVDIKTGQTTYVHGIKNSRMIRKCLGDSESLCLLSI